MDLFSNDILDTQSPIKLPNKAGYSQKWNDDRKLFIIKIPNGELMYAPVFFNEQHSDHMLNYLLESEDVDWNTTDWKSVIPELVKWKNVLWQHDKVRMFGKHIPLPRFSAWYGDNDKPYSYSGLTLQPKPWNTGLWYIKEKIETVANVKFNSVLLNWYRSGEDHISWHTDAEPELGKNPVIGSVNFGATRKFQLRRIDNNKEKIEIPLNHGTLLLMGGETQHYWQHSVPKEKTVDKTRINLTFREIKLNSKLG